MGLFGQNPVPKEDPKLAAEKQRAEKDRVEAIRDGVTRDTENLLRVYGARRALSGASPLRLGR